MKPKKAAKNMEELILVDMRPIGTLVIFTLRTKGDNTSGIDNFYWRDASSPKGFGPFDSISKCTEHHKHMFLQFKATGTLPNMLMVKQNVIHLDFVNKRRL